MMKWQQRKEEYSSTEYPFLYETHLHTCQGSACAKNTGAEMARAAKEYGYTGIIVTEHNWGGNTCLDGNLSWEDWMDAYAAGYRAAKEEGRKIGLDVFFGMEAGFDGTEFLLYGLTPEWFKQHPEVKQAQIGELYEMVKGAGGLMIHAHPFREEPYIPQIRLFPEWVDGVEGMNATHSCSKSTKHNDPAFDKRAIEYANKNRLPMTAGSDVHTTAMLGGGMAFRRRLKDMEDFIRAVKTGEDYILTNGDNCYTRYGELL